jgi:hypothetical protein
MDQMTPLHDGWTPTSAAARYGGTIHKEDFR